MPASPSGFASGRKPGGAFARNVAWNLLGIGLPSVCVIVSIPILVRVLGDRQFGALMVMTPLLGYASVLDFGLGRALTKLVAEKLALGLCADVPALFLSGALLALAYGAMFGLILAAAARPLVSYVLSIPLGLRSDAREAVYLLGAGLLLTIASNAMRGTLEAMSRFDLTNGVRTVSGVLFAGGPLAVLPFSHRLPALVAAMVAARAFSCLALCALCLWNINGMGAWWPGRRFLGPLARFGGWVAASNIAGQLLFYCDRLAVGHLFSVDAIAFLVVPQDVYAQLLLVPNAVCGVLYPLFVGDFAGTDPRAGETVKQGARYVFLLVFPIAFVLGAFAHFGLSLWLGPQFAHVSGPVAACCAVALLVSAAGLVPFAALQAAHRPDLPAKVYLAEAIPYLLGLWWATRTFGLVGTAAVFTLRIAVEAALFWLSASRLDAHRSGLGTGAVKLFAIPICLVALAALAPLGAIEKAVACVVAGVVWLIVFSESARNQAASGISLPKWLPSWQ